MSQLIELVWRNKAYVEAIREADGVSGRAGALFAGFKTEMVNQTSGTGSGVKKTRSEYINYDRVLAYPGVLQDNLFSYRVGPQRGLDPASLDLPMTHQIPRSVATDNYNDRERVDLDTFHTETIKGYGTTLGPGHPATADASDLNKVPENGRPTPYLAPGMMIRKRPRNADDTMVTAETFSKLTYVEDIDFNNMGECSTTIDLQESVAGTPATLKKIVLQFSKENHHVSEITLDFSDITRGSGSISSSAAPRQNELTILCDGKSRLQTIDYDCKMGNFGANKFKLTVSSISYFPPLVTPAGGFDPGSHIAVIENMNFGCEKMYEPAALNEQNLEFLAAPMASYDEMGIRRLPTQALPNPLRDASVDDVGGGAQNVADAVNKGFNVIGAVSSTGASKNYESNRQRAGYKGAGGYAASMIDTQDNIVTAGTGSGNTLDTDLNVQWRRVGCSSYTVKPRETRGSLLACNVVLESMSI